MMMKFFGFFEKFSLMNLTHSFSSFFNGIAIVSRRSTSEMRFLDISVYMRFLSISTIVIYANYFFIILARLNAVDRYVHAEMIKRVVFFDEKYRTFLFVGDMTTEVVVQFVVFLLMIAWFHGSSGFSSSLGRGLHVVTVLLASFIPARDVLVQSSSVVTGSLVKGDVMTRFDLFERRDMFLSPFKTASDLEPNAFWLTLVVICCSIVIFRIFIDSVGSFGRSE